MPRTAEFQYKQDHPFEKRATEAARIRDKYPDRIPGVRGGPRPHQISSDRPRRDTPATASSRCLPPRATPRSVRTSPRPNSPDRAEYARPLLSSDLREGRAQRHPARGQAQVPDPDGPDGGTVCLRDPQAAVHPRREGHLHLCPQHAPAHRCAHVDRLRAAQGRGWLHVHDVQRGEHVWRDGGAATTHSLRNERLRECDQGG
eukprot:6403865-Prymnesium_polylepis.1